MRGAERPSSSEDRALASNSASKLRCFSALRHAVLSAHALTTHRNPLRSRLHVTLRERPKS